MNSTEKVAVDDAGVAYFEAKLRFETTPATLNYNLDKGKVFLVDGRDRADYEDEHIPGAVSIPLAELEKNLEQLPRDKTIVAYGWHIACAIGPKSALLLARHGFKTQELSGGIELWKARKLKTTCK